MTNYPKSAYGTHNPNSGYPANGNWSAWGGYCYPAGVPSSLMGTTNYTNRTNGQTMRVQMRKELVPLWNLCFEICDRKHNYPVWANKGGENWGPWGYANRPISGSNNPSGHSAALSVDMNAPYNPYSSTWCSDMPPAMVADLESLGLYWGGRYSGKYDAMHYGYCRRPQDVAGYISRAQYLLGQEPTDGDDDEVKSEDIDEIVKRVWDRIIQPDGANTPAWALLVQARNNTDNILNETPQVLTGQTRTEALANTRNDVYAIKAKVVDGG